MYRRDIADVGSLKNCDVCSTKENLNPEQGFFIMGLINSMPASWRLAIKRAITAPVIDPFPDSPAILISNNLAPILDASSKQIYRLFLEKKQTTPTAKVKLAAKHSNIDIDWKSVYSLSFRTTSESKLREFPYCLYKRKTFRFGMAESPSCAFCQTEVESVSIYSFPVEYHLVFGNMSCPGCAIITSLLITLKKRVSFLVSSILQKIFSCLTIFCFWVSFIFTLGNTRMVYLLFKVL